MHIHLEGLGPDLNPETIDPADARRMINAGVLSMQRTGVDMITYNQILRDGFTAAACVATLLPLHNVISLTAAGHPSTTSSASSSSSSSGGSSSTKKLPNVLLALEGQPLADYGICRGRWTRPDWHYVYHYHTPTSSSSASKGGSSSKSSSSSSSGKQVVVRHHPDQHYWLYFQRASGKEVRGGAKEGCRPLDRTQQLDTICYGLCYA